ncbi:MAG: hypothetical protein KAS76_00205, partial [Thermoplasmatales archaeon]|nr:hypothetical protein [Thermoplasmatales archaeon]
NNFCLLVTIDSPPFRDGVEKEKFVSRAADRNPNRSSIPSRACTDFFLFHHSVGAILFIPIFLIYKRE